MKVPTKTDPAAVVVPFGKYKGSTVAELLVTDESYAQWILTQGWVAERFAELHAALVRRGASTDDTPAHNIMQARFLDYAFQQAFLNLAYGQHISKSLSDHISSTANELRGQIRRHQMELEESIKYLKSPKSWDWQKTDAAKTQSTHPALIVKDEYQLAQLNTASSWTMRVYPMFEQRGVDVVLKWHWTGPFLPDNWSGSHLSGLVNVELKPGLGDDYPTVMRQMQRLGSTILVIGEYNGTAVTEDQVRRMFAANGSRVILMQEIETMLPKRLAF